MPYEFTATVWKTPPPGVWHFLTLPPDLADEIDERTTGLQGGFGSVKVDVRIGATTWSTSIFPSKEAASFILPVKQAVRRAENCEAGSVVVVILTLVGLD